MKKGPAPYPTKFQWPFTTQTWLRSAQNFAKTHCRRFPTFHFLTPNKTYSPNFRIPDLTRKWEFVKPVSSSYPTTHGICKVGDVPYRNAVTFAKNRPGLFVANGAVWLFQKGTKAQAGRRQGGKKWRVARLRTTFLISNCFWNWKNKWQKLEQSNLKRQLPGTAKQNP